MTISDRPAASGSATLPPRLDPRAGRPARPSASGRPPGPRGRGERLARAARVLAGVLTLLLLATTGWGWYLGQVASASVNRADVITGTGNGGRNGTDMNLLLVGSDSRNDASAAQLKQLMTQDDGGGVNTDTMILVHVPADGSKASFVSFPRDSYVQIPGHGWDKLNSAYAYGMADAGSKASDADQQAAGAQLLIRTIGQLTGLQIDHYAQVDLLGFFNLSNVVGGVEVNLCAPVKDSFSGVNLPAGVQTISGSQALAFVRQRHGLVRGDFDRIIRQQTFIAGIIRKMVSENVLLNLSKQHQLVQAVAQSLTVDRNLDLFQLAQQMQSVKPGDIKFQTIPYVGDDQDSQGRYILRLKDADTEHQFFTNLSADAPAQAGPAAASTSAAPAAPQTLPPAQVTVSVLNGSGVAGLAATAGADLRAKGYVVPTTGNADSAAYTQTEIRYAAGDDKLAATVATAVPGAVTKQVTTASKGTVQLVLGSDFTKVGTPVSGGSPGAASSASPAAPTGEDVRTADDTGCIN